MLRKTQSFSRAAVVVCAGALMLAALACTFSLGEESPDPSAERTQEAAYLQQTVAAQVTLMAGSPVPADEPDAQAQTAPQPAEPCLVAFHSDREGSKDKIFVFDPASGETRRLSPAGDWTDRHRRGTRTPATASCAARAW